MNKQVILLTDAETAPATELIASLNSAGILVLAHDLAETRALTDLCPERSPRPLAVLYDISPAANPERLSLAVSRARNLWPGTSIVACRRELSTAFASNRPDNQALKRLGFRAIADSPSQLPTLLRQIEDIVGTGELKLPKGFKPIPDSRAFTLPSSARSQHLRGAFTLLTSLHLASDQKEAGVAALAGVARLVPADRWSIFLVTQSSGPDAVKLEPLASRNFAEAGPLLFDRAWQRELLVGDIESSAEPESKTTHEAINRIEAMRKVESGRRVIALPLVSGERVVGNEIKRARRYRSNVAALFLDLDDFKQINDFHGHLAGSHALMELAAVVLPSVRDTDCVVRYGGDEFVLILTETGIEEAVRVAERLRAKIEAYRFTGGRKLNFTLTASFGVAVFPLHALSPQQLIACADRAMYQAKAADKNCVRVIVDSEKVNRDDRPGSSLIGQTQFQRIPDEKLIS